MGFYIQVCFGGDCCVIGGGNILPKFLPKNLNQLNAIN